MVALTQDNHPRTGSETREAAERSKRSITSALSLLTLDEVRQLVKEIEEHGSAARVDGLARGSEQ